jgi:hypothetical protein
MRSTDAGARVVREGDALRFHGPVLRDRVATLWLAATPADFEALRQAYRLDARLQPLA